MMWFDNASLMAAHTSCSEMPTSKHWVLRIALLRLQSLQIVSLFNAMLYICSLLVLFVTLYNVMYVY